MPILYAILHVLYLMLLPCLLAITDLTLSKLNDLINTETVVCLSSTCMFNHSHQNIYLTYCHASVAKIGLSVMQFANTSAFTFDMIHLAAFTTCFVICQPLACFVCGSTVFAFVELLPLHVFYLLLCLVFIIFDLFLALVLIEPKSPFSFRLSSTAVCDL